jgi:phosphoglycerate dehydrogenase-like enzyme
MLAAEKALPASARARSWEADGRYAVHSLAGQTVAIVGAGGIGRALISLLAPFGAEAIAVTRRGRPVEGAVRTLPADRAAEVFPEADYVVVAAPATDGTRHIVGAAELAAMREDAWLVNVARGSLVDTDALVEALRSGSIAGAALDVTDPEPLPDGHPLFSAPGVTITPHVAGDVPLFPRRAMELIADQVRRYLADEPLRNVVSDGY